MGKNKKKTFNPFNFFKYIFYGFITIATTCEDFIKHIFYGFKYLPIIVFSLFSSFTLDKKIKEEVRKEKLIKKATESYQKESSSSIRKDLFKTKIDELIESIKKKFNRISFVKNYNLMHDINAPEMILDYNGPDAVRTKIKHTYEYIIRTPDKKVTKGYFAAYSVIEVHSFLKSEQDGVEVLSIRTSKWIETLHGHVGKAAGKFKTKDLIFLLAQLSTYLKASIPLADAIKILQKQFKNPTYKEILRSVAYDLSIGMNFSEALEDQQGAFPRLLINMIKASEMTGQLPETLDDMDSYYTETEETRKAMVTAMIYPSIIFVVAIGVGTFIMLYVVPKFVDIYASMDDAEIPGITKFVLWLSSFLKNYLLYIALAIVILLAIFIYLYKHIKKFRKTVQYITMKIPVIGTTIIYNEVTMFTKTFASLLAHNVFITDTMDILNQVTDNEIYKEMIMDAMANVAKGGHISTAFKDKWAFPIPAYEMIVTGEKTGQLPEMMSKVSSYYQDLHKNQVTRIKTFVEPVMIVLLTIMVGVIVLSIVIPMFNMYSQISDSG